MPAAGGLVKSQLDFNSKVESVQLLRSHQIEPLFRPVSELLQLCSYILLWKDPSLSAALFIWLNFSILCHILLATSTFLSATFSTFLLVFNITMLEHCLSQTNIMMITLKAALGIGQGCLEQLPGSDGISQGIASFINGIAGVFHNLKDSSKKGRTQFWFALCTSAAMVTIVLTYLASTTTFLLLFWGIFCYPAIKHHNLYQKISQEQIMNVLHMSMYMLYNVYLSIVKIASSNEAVLSASDEGDLAPRLREDVHQELSEPLTFRQSTMSYLRGLPSIMTLNWGTSRGWGSLLSRDQLSDQKTVSTEEDSDYGIDDIEEDKQVTGKTTRTQTIDTIGSNAELEFPDFSHKDTLDTERDTTLLAAELDPNLLYDDEVSDVNTDTLGTDFGFTLGGPQQLQLLDAVKESSESDSDDRILTSVEPSPSPQLTTITSSRVSKDDTLDGKEFSLYFQPSPPENPKPHDNTRNPRVKIPSNQTEDSEFHVISDEEIRAADDEISSNASSASLRERLSGRLRQLSGGENPVI